jgi:hypothetical protein
MNNETQHRKVNILIDTCSLVDLLCEDINKLLPHLEFWKNHDCINFITHKVILEEWDKHKQKKKNEFTQSLKTKYKHTAEIVRKENLSIPQNLEPNIQNIEIQIKLIDELLNSGTTLDTSDDIKIFCSDRTISRKAPYHTKLDSTKDAYIIFSAIKHFEKLGQDFLFISANKSDFGSPQNLEMEIHPEIIEDYPSVKIRYFSDIGRAISVLREELPISLLSEKASSEKSNYVDDSIEIDKTKHILDQVYDYISFIKSEIGFYPITLLINHYPFRTSNKSFSYYSNFTLYTDNQRLIELFSSIEITEDNTINITNTELLENVDDFLSKIKFVLNTLSKNLIFTVSNKKSIEVRFHENTECECPLCNFRAFKFVECFNTINSLSDSDYDLQKSSYLNYMIGDYVIAIEKQKAFFKKLNKKQQKTQCFISQFNLSKLSHFLWNYFGEDFTKELEEELQKIDLKYESANFSTKENRKLINYISENRFYLNAKDRIQISTNKLRDQYYISLNGGWSSNSEAWHLICEFAILDSFLSNNFIIYTKFSEFNELFATFTEGLLVSHATNGAKNSRLEAFDDWLIYRLLIYGDSQVINKFYRRYKLEKINYKKTSQGDSFVDLINNFFNNNELREAFNNNCCKKSNRSFWDYYDKIFKNILTLVSICNFDNSYICEFTHKLIDYLGKGDAPRDFVQYINTFLYRCGEELDSEILQKLFNLAIDNPLLHKLNYFEALFYVIDYKKKRLSIDEEGLNKVMKFIFEECPICKEKHSEEIIIQTYLLIDNQIFKDKITTVIIQKLSEQFDFDLFYKATLFEIIPFDENLFATVLASSYSKASHSTYKSVFFNPRKNRYGKIDAMINLCFKLSIDTNTDEFQVIKTLDKYYEWLVDLNNFDYDYFDPQWISEYSTKYYFRKFYGCKLLKEKLNQIIKKGFDAQLERDYINIYVRKTWNKRKPNT